MEQMKKHKLHILLPVMLVVLSLIVSLLSGEFGTGGSAKNHVALGQQYLNDLDYSAAILEFSNAISVDPTNKDARIGLAQVYSQSGNYTFAAEVLQDVLDENALDPEITQQLIQIYQESGQDGAVLHLIDRLIEQTDDDVYYEQKKEILTRLCSTPHTYAVGTDQVLKLSVDGVQSRGSNTLGQLGTAQELGVRGMEQTDFADADFPGTARSVYCAGRTSYVIDENGDLWAAGENRWGQMGLSYGTALPESGWVRLTDTGDVAAVAGGSGELLMLRTDGTLWVCGGSNGQILTRSTQFGTVLRICTSLECHYLLTGEGKLYRQYIYDSSETWEYLLSNVADFTAVGSEFYWRTFEGNMGSYYGISFPSNWEWNDDGTVVPDFDVRAMAANGRLLFFLNGEGVLYQLDSYGALNEVQTGSPVSTLFSEAGRAVAVLENGKLLLWENGVEQYIEL